MNNLGKWIKERYGSQQGLADELGLQQARISKWLSGAESISETYQGKLRALKYKGPWPREEVQQAEAPAAGDYVSREEFEQMRDNLEDACEVIRFLLTRLPAESRPGVLPKRFR